jgi:hypothetical protein
MRFAYSKFGYSLCLTLLVSASAGLARYDDAKCCASASSSNAFSPTPTHAIICGQEFNASIPAAATLYIPYIYCKEHCGGFGLSKGSKPGSWAAPIVQFILPFAIFSMSIPRRKMLAAFARRGPDAWGTGPPNRMGGTTTKLKYAISKLKPALQLCVMMLDNIVWIALILALAGPMMLSGLYEAVLDWKILDTLLSEVGRQLDEAAAVELLATVVSGNLRHKAHEANPQAEIRDALLTSAKPEARRARLLGLVDSQMGYGAIVGAPVVFYLGAFVYSILDLSNKPSDQDAAISLAFGVERMIIVHVAIIGSCVLASNNPSTASVLVGRLPSQSSHDTTRSTTTENLAGQLQPGLWKRLHHENFDFLADIYDNRYQPVTMWSSGRNKKHWVHDSDALLGPLNTSHHLKVGWWAKSFLVFLPTCVLINLPPVAGAVVAWRTPPIGWGCRSLSFICYAGAQLFVTALFILMQASRHLKSLLSQ